jgi:SNF2 family DNA or RNA helicase
VKVPLSEEDWKLIKSTPSFIEANEAVGCSEDTFTVVHSQENYQGPYKHADELKELLAPAAFFKNLRDCVDMPEELSVLRELTMPPDIKKCYEEMAAELMAEYDGKVMTASSKITALIKLQQISSGFIRADMPEEEEEAEPLSDHEKLLALYGALDAEYDAAPDQIAWIGSTNPKLEALYRDLEGQDKPAIVLTRFTAEAARIYDDLKGSYKTCLLTGWRREGSVQEYQDGKYEVMVANSAVVSRGLNLQNGHVMNFYSNTFSLETRIQAEGRIFRIGQRNPCLYTDYVYPGTVDDKIAGSLRLKRSLLEYLINADIKEIAGGAV